MRTHRTAMLAGCLSASLTVIAGAALASTQNPDSADASIASIDDGFGSRLTGSSGDKTGYSKYDDIGGAPASINHGLGDISDGFGRRLTGNSGGHAPSALGSDSAKMSIAAAGLNADSVDTATTDAGAFASG